MDFKSGKSQYPYLAALLLVLAFCNFLPAQELNQAQKVTEIIAALTDSLNLSEPVIPDVHCGEWTPDFERELRKVLLQKGADVRESSLQLLEQNDILLPEDSLNQQIVKSDLLLARLQLQQASLLEITLEQSEETFEQRNFISYKRFKRPIYRFVLKQIELPEQKLIALREYNLSGQPEMESPGSVLAMKWYEPLVACAIVGSLIYALWTIK